MKKFVKTNTYIELKRNLGQDLNLIQVIHGPRGVGKTGLVRLLIDKDFPGKTLMIDTESVLVPNFNWLKQKWQDARDSFDLLVIDEIQKIENWSELVKKLWDEDRARLSKLRVVLLGSSSLEIQKGLSESLTGRFQMIRAFHWSFLESKALSEFSFDEYLKFGGYPASYFFKDRLEEFINYLQVSILSTVIDKDILTNHKVKSPALFKQCFELINSYPAQEISYTKLLGQLQDKGNTDLVKYYLSLFEGAFLIKQIFKYSEKPIKSRTSSPKILPLCPSFYFLQVQDDYNSEEYGRAFELVVGATLSRLPIEIFYWRDGKHEVDFVVKKGKKIVGIEVKSGRRKREAGLEAFRQKHPNAQVMFITPDNYLRLEKEGLDFIFD